MPLDFDPATLLTYQFVHGGFLHLVGNLFFLWIFGDNVEDRLGHLAFVFFYLACGVGAVLLDFLFNPWSPVPRIGASGAIAGCMGAYLRLFPKINVRTWVFDRILDVPAWVYIGLWFAGQFLFFLLSQSANYSPVSYVGHVGGFLAGFILVQWWRR